MYRDFIDSFESRASYVIVSIDTTRLVKGRNIRRHTNKGVEIQSFIKADKLKRNQKGVWRSNLDLRG